ncbi:MAG: penicillin-binding protein 2 [Vicinamibacterales bacterium]
MASPLVTDRRTTATRLTAFSAAVIAVFGTLAVAFWYFQVVEGATYARMAENNHLRRLSLRAPRGVMFDRDGQLLVENRDAFTISVLREHSAALEQTIQRLAVVARVDEQEIRETIRRHRGEPNYRPITVIDDATLAQVSAVLARRLDHELPGVVVERVPTRRYPSVGLGAHVLGYVGEVGEAQMAADGLRSGSVVGQSGVEKAYNTMLMGTDGERRVMVDSVGREISTLDEVPASEGRRVRLTIDYALQQAAEDAFHALGYEGAAVILDPRSGEVLALVSLPAYDPNDFAAGIDRATWSLLNTDRLRPLQNRAIQGRYSPGSTFKAVVAVAALEEGVITPDFKVTCRGGATFFGRFFRCHLKGGHGTMDLRHAIEKSCNTYFYTVGNMVGVDRLHKWAAALGLAGRTGIDLPNEVESLVPSTAWKKARTGERWYPGETISVSIGQGQVSVTPLALAAFYAAVGNGGIHYPPRLLKATNDGSGWRPVDQPSPRGVRLKPETIAALHDGLWMVVNGSGTGRRARVAGRDVSGKTGTAQVISLQGGRAAAGRTEMDLRDHGWFAFFAPRDNPEIAGVIFAEHGEHGSSAAPIARHVIETYFAKKDGFALPVFTAPAVPAVPAAPAAPGPAAGGEGR